MKWLMNLVKFFSGDMIDKAELEVCHAAIASLRATIDAQGRSLDRLERHIVINSGGEVVINDTVTIAPNNTQIRAIPFPTDALTNSYIGQYDGRPPVTTAPIPPNDETIAENDYPTFRMAPDGMYRLETPPEPPFQPRADIENLISRSDREDIIRQINAAMNAALITPISGSASVTNLRANNQTNTISADIMIQVPRPSEEITINFSIGPEGVIGTGPTGRPDDTTNERQLDPTI